MAFSATTIASMKGAGGGSGGGGASGGDAVAADGAIVAAADGEGCGAALVVAAPDAAARAGATQGSAGVRPQATMRPAATAARWRGGVARMSRQAIDARPRGHACPSRAG